MNLLDFRAAVIADLEAGLPSLNFEAHGGRFDFAELDNYAISAPEVRVAILSARRSPKGRRMWDVGFAAYPIAGRDRHMLASERGLVMVTALMMFIDERGLGGAGGATGVQYQNLYSSDARDRNKHLSAITWTQQVELSSELTEQQLNDFLKFAASYDLAPVGGTIVATDNVDLPPPEAP